MQKQNTTRTDDGSWWADHLKYCEEQKIHPATLMPLDGSPPLAWTPYQPRSAPPVIDWFWINQEFS